MKTSTRTLLFATAASLAASLLGVPLAAAPSAASPDVTVLEAEGRVETTGTPAAAWEGVRPPQTLPPGARVRTGERSRALLRLLDQTSMRLGELSEFLVEPSQPAGPGGYNLRRGLFYLFHRDKPAEIPFRTRTAAAIVRGTEFQLAVDDNGRTVLTLFDGSAELSSAQGSIQLRGGEQGVVEPGQAPVRSPLLLTVSVIQWCLHYPGVLEPGELSLTPAETTALELSLAAYRAGDLLSALSTYPAGRAPASDAERVYLGSILLAVGRVEPAEALLSTVAPGMGAPGGRPSAALLAAAVQRVIATVKGQPAAAAPSAHGERSATEWLALSYEDQARGDLDAALRSARQATARAPGFGFAWNRVAELEFSFGRTRAARLALEKGIALSPRNAEAFALKGFFLTADNRIAEALREFDRAIALDGALGNAWLGRGLCRIRGGDLDGGREDLQAAATLEPQRALFRSYLGKAWQQLGQTRQARAELALGTGLDSLDPTGAFYSALLLQQNNRINEAIAGLEQAQTLNDNRALYRSRLLLDQDRAVRGVNLANVYRDAGMMNWSAREAGRAVNADYANYSAHLFLANSFNELRDPRGVNLRYETPWFSEYLVANLLAPVGAGTLSQAVSQNEYSKLFERDRVGIVSVTEYLSRGAWSQTAVQHGTFGNTGYALEGGYLSDSGEQPNGAVEQYSLSLQLKQQFGPEDTLYLQALTAETRGGDLKQYYDPGRANRALKFEDEQKPLLIAGYHHEWGPGSHTLALASRLSSRLNVDDPHGQSRDFYRSNGVERQIFTHVYDQRYHGELEIYGGELQHILEGFQHTLILGGQAQAGQFDTRNRHIPIDPNADLYWGSLAGKTNLLQHSEAPLLRLNIYAYEFWRVLPWLQLIGGLTYDSIRFPRNHRFAPVDDSTDRVDDFLPKAGLVVDLSERSTARFAYTRSLSGASLDQSFRLEPVQVAGFNQAFRSIIPETIEGANAGARFETFDLGWEQRIGPGTYAGVTLELLRSTLDREVGGYGRTNFAFPFTGRLREQLEYEERSMVAELDQLVGQEWVLGGRYRWSAAELINTWRDASSTIDVAFDPGTGDPIRSSRRTRSRGDLHEATLRLLFNHPSGFFAGTDGTWWAQAAEATGRDLPAASLFQWNLHVGWRSPRRRLELGAGLLNILNTHHGLHPINLHTDPPRERTLATSLRFAF